MIRTETKHFYSGESTIYTFIVPSFSEVKKIYMIENMIYMIIEYPNEYESDCSKSINLVIQDYTQPTKFYGDEHYKYFDTQIVSKTELVNSSYTSSIQFTTVNLAIPYHFFIQEIKSFSEMRDNKIDEIIND